MANWYKKLFIRKKIDLPKGKIKIGLALSGGGTKGFAHIGAIKAFEEAGIKFDMVAGTSAGALAGAFYCFDYTSTQMFSIVENIKESDIKTNPIPFMPSSSNGLEKMINAHLLDEKIENSKTPLIIVATNMQNGKEEHLKSGNLAKSIAASCAVPFVFNPVFLEDKTLMDGGILNNLPSSALRDAGCDFVVGIDLNSERGTGTNSTKLFDLVIESINMMMKSNCEKGATLCDVLITPNTKKYKSSRLSGGKEMFDEGYKAAKEKIDEIQKLFEIKYRKG